MFLFSLSLPLAPISRTPHFVSALSFDFHLIFSDTYGIILMLRLDLPLRWRLSFCDKLLCYFLSYNPVTIDQSSRRARK